jgi:drug/metabolite transporter (DMT)-like permease
MLGIIFVFIACLFWGFDTLFRYPLVMKGFHPVLLVSIEHLILTLIFASGFVFKLNKLKKLKLDHIICFLMVGSVGSALATVAFTKSFLYLNPSLVILLQKFQPVFAVSMAAIFLKEKLNRGFLLWSSFSFFGGILISYPDILTIKDLLNDQSIFSLTNDTLKGYGLVFVSILGWASATVFGKKLTQLGYNTKQILGGRFLTGFVTLIWFCPLDVNLLLVEVRDYLQILLMVFISGVLAMSLYYQGMMKLQAKNLAIVEMFFPLSAVIINWYFLDKHLLLVQLIGGVILIFGSIIIQFKKY